MKILSKYLIVFLLFFSGKTFGQWTDFANIANSFAATGTNSLNYLVLDNQRQLFYLIVQGKIVFYDQHNSTNGWKELGGVGALYNASSGYNPSSDIVLDNVGNVYVGCNSINGYKIWKFDISTNSWLDPFQEIEKAPNPNYPYPSNDNLLYLAIDRNNKIYATGSFINGNGAYYVQNVTQNVEVGSGSNTLSSVNTSNVRCSGIAITKGNTNATIITVSLFSVNEIYSFDNSTNNWSLLGNISILHKTFGDDLVYDGNDKLYTEATLTSATGPYNAVVKWSGTSWTEVGAPKQLGANAFGIYGLYIDKIGNIYCSGVNTGTNTHPLYQISKFTPNGTSGSWSKIGTLNANLVVNSIAVDINCNIYACGDFSNGSNHSAGNKYVAVWGDPSLNVLSVSTPIFNFCQNGNSQQLDGVTSNCSSCQIWWKLLPNGTPSNSAPTPSTNNVTPPAINYLVYQTNPNACAEGNPSATIAVNVNPLPTVAIITGPTKVCTGKDILLADITPNGQWSSQSSNVLVDPTYGTVHGVAGGSATIQYEVTLPTGCKNKATYAITIDDNCDDGFVKCTKNYIDLKDVTTTTITPGTVYGILNSITIPTGTTTTFTDDEIIILGDQVTITVQTGAKLIIEGSHLYSCETMWKGIEVEPGGELQITGTKDHSSFIEDAEVAVHFDFNFINDELTIPPSGYFLSVDNAIFNRNNIGISLENYYTKYDEKNDYPFVIKNTVFTSREIKFVSGDLKWDDVEMLKNVYDLYVNKGNIYPATPIGLSSPYIDEITYSSSKIAAFLKYPYNDLKPSAGIYLNHVGTKSDIDYDKGNYFAGIKIGMSDPEPEITNKDVINKIGNTFNTNVFDNMTDYGIGAFSSNLTVVNCTFQKGYIDKYDGTVSACGIFTFRDLDDRVHLYRLNVIRESNKVPTNAFFDQRCGITSQSICHNTINETDIRSTKDYNNDNLVGVYGIVLSTQQLSSIDINYNNIYNISQAIRSYSDIGYTNGNLGAVNVLRNNIGGCPYQSKLDGCTGIERVDNAISLVTGYSNTIRPSTNLVKCDGNIIRDATNGIKLSNWQRKSLTINSNLVDLMPYTDRDLNQYGIRLEACAAGVINRKLVINEIKENIVNGHAAHYSAGIEMEMNENTDVGCNEVMENMHGFRFVNKNGGTKWWNNTMHDDNQNGMTLDNNGYIGDQGYYDQYVATNNCTSDNTWVNWSSGNFKTACFAGSDAASSVLYVNNNGGDYDPSGANPNNTGNPYSTNGAPPSIVPIAPGFSCNRCGQFARTTGARSALHNSMGGNTSKNMAARAGSLLSYDERIALGVLPIAGNDSALQLYVLQQQLYDKLINDSDLASSSLVFQGFVSNTASNNIGQFHIVDSLLAANDSNAVATMLGNIQTSNTVDEHYLAYYNWMLNMVKGIGILPQDTAAIFSLASGCPSIDGMVVFAARNLYNNIRGSIYNFVDICGTKVSNRNSNVKNIHTKKEDANVVKVFPNPTRGDVNVQLPTAGNWQIIASDIAGRVVWKEEGSTGTIKHTLKGSSGVYFIKVINKRTGTQSVHKVTLQ